MKADTVLFNKYRLDHVIGRGRTGTVWLAVHLGLEEYRAIKQIPKSAVDYEAFRREALVLKSLRHPAVPIIYDLEEDQNFLYLIQEYIKGESLYALVKRQGIIREPEAVRYGIQICALIEFLHLAGETPILFLDLQPKNLIVCDGVVKLIDFGQAAPCGVCRDGGVRYGTVGCAAPEQYTSDQLLDTRTDIYAIGAVLSFMVNGEFGAAGQAGPGVSAALTGIIRKCMETDRDKRFDSAGELERRLSGLLTTQRGAQKNDIQAMPSLVIAVVGSREGAGATHLALALCRYLGQDSVRVVYEERNQSGHIRRLAEYFGARGDSCGLYHVSGMHIRPWYGEAVSLSVPEAEVYIRDYGTEWDALGADFLELPGDCRTAIVAVGGGSVWERRDCERMLCRLKPVWTSKSTMAKIFLSRHFGGGVRRFRREAGELPEGIKLFLEPFFGDPFWPDSQATEFLSELWAVLTGGRTKKRGWFGRCRIGRGAQGADEGKGRASAG